MTEKNERLNKLAAVTPEAWEAAARRAEALMAAHRFGCSECLMLAFQETLGPDQLPPTAVAMASAFRGGLGGAGCLCGALAAAEMILSSVFGYHSGPDGQQDLETVKHSRALNQELHNRFREANRSTCCRVLTDGLTPHSPESLRHCTGLVLSAARLLGEILTRETQGSGGKAAI